MPKINHYQTMACLQTRQLLRMNVQAWMNMHGCDILDYCKTGALNSSLTEIGGYTTSFTTINWLHVMRVCLSSKYSVYVTHSIILFEQNLHEGYLSIRMQVLVVVRGICILRETIKLSKTLKTGSCHSANFFDEELLWCQLCRHWWQCGMW